MYDVPSYLLRVSLKFYSLIIFYDRPGIYRKIPPPFLHFKKSLWFARSYFQNNDNIR